jgi:hypothetical protein
MTPQSRWRKFIHRLRSDEDTSLGFSVTTKLTTATGPTRSYSFYTPDLQLLSETALSDAVTPPIAYDFVRFGGEPLAQINATTGEIAYDFNDHLGAPVMQTTVAGTVAWRAEQAPYGDRYLLRAAAIAISRRDCRGRRTPRICRSCSTTSTGGTDLNGGGIAVGSDRATQRLQCFLVR